MEEKEPEKLTLTYERKQTLRYGENSHQAAAFYQSALLEKYSIAAANNSMGKNFLIIISVMRMLRYDHEGI